MEPVTRNPVIRSILAFLQHIRTLLPSPSKTSFLFQVSTLAADNIIYSALIKIYNQIKPHHHIYLNFSNDKENILEKTIQEELPHLQIQDLIGDVRDNIISIYVEKHLTSAVINPGPIMIYQELYMPTEIARIWRPGYNFQSLHTASITKPREVLIEDMLQATQEDKHLQNANESQFCFFRANYQEYQDYVYRRKESLESEGKDAGPIPVYLRRYERTPSPPRQPQTPPDSPVQYTLSTPPPLPYQSPPIYVHDSEDSDSAPASPVSTSSYGEDVSEEIRRTLNYVPAEDNTLPRPDIPPTPEADDLIDEPVDEDLINELLDPSDTASSSAYSSDPEGMYADVDTDSEWSSEPDYIRLYEPRRLRLEEILLDPPPPSPSISSDSAVIMISSDSDSDY